MCVIWPLRRIAFHSATRTFGVITVRHDVPVTADGVSQYVPARTRSVHPSVCLSLCVLFIVLL